MKRVIPKKYFREMSYLYSYLRSLYFFGFKYQCNFYKGHFRRLLPTGLKNDIALSLIGEISLFFVSPVSFVVGPRTTSLLVHS